MKNEKVLDKLNEIVSSESSKWLEKAKWRKANREWLDKSARIAIKVLRELRAKKMSQKELAVILNVTPQYINKIVKGHENLSLETINKLEKALGMSLVTVSSFETIDALHEITFLEAIGVEKKIAKPINSVKSYYKTYSNYRYSKKIHAIEIAKKIAKPISSVKSEYDTYTTNQSSDELIAA